jgi:hypothetical protein
MSTSGQVSSMTYHETGGMNYGKLDFNPVKGGTKGDHETQQDR